MSEHKYQLRYLPIFETDLKETIMYIKNHLKNPGSAHKLLNEVELAIMARLNNPTSFEPYPTAKIREYPYYRIYIRNYIIFYVVIDEIMEVRRFLYNARDLTRFL